MEPTEYVFTRVYFHLIHSGLVTRVCVDLLIYHWHKECIGTEQAIVPTYL